MPRWLLSSALSSGGFPSRVHWPWHQWDSTRSRFLAIVRDTQAVFHVCSVGGWGIPPSLDYLRWLQSLNLGSVTETVMGGLVVLMVLMAAVENVQVMLTLILSPAWWWWWWYFQDQFVNRATCPLDYINILQSWILLPGSTAGSCPSSSPCTPLPDCTAVQHLDKNSLHTLLR